MSPCIQRIYPSLHVGGAWFQEFDVPLEYEHSNPYQMVADGKSSVSFVIGPHMVSYPSPQNEVTYSLDRPLWLKPLPSNAY